VFRKAAFTCDQLSSLVGTLLFAGGSAWIHRRLRYGDGFRGGAGDSSRFRNAGGVVVFHRPAGLPQDTERERGGAPPMDDSQLRVDACRGYSAQLDAAHAFCPALAIPSDVHHGVLAVLGSEFARRGMVDPAPNLKQRWGDGDRVISFSPAT